jgi:hypothetical protein
MTSCEDLSFDYLDNNTILKSFQYKSFSQRAGNFFLKNFIGKNLKHQHYNSSMEKALDQLEKAYKKILIIRPDLFSDHYLQILRDRTDCFIAYYWDTVNVVPRKKDIVQYFDRILSFDPQDCEKYGFEFQPNFYYYEKQSYETRYQVYSLSTLDGRKEIMEELAAAFDGAGLSYLLKGFNEKPFKNEYIQYTPRISYQQMLSEAKYCDIVLDVTKAGQIGLTFRPFEALGLGKKLITTNASIKEYEFYNPDNILIVEPGKICLSKEFFERPLREIPDVIKRKYHIKQWLGNVLGDQILSSAVF